MNSGSVSPIVSRQLSSLKNIFGHSKWTHKSRAIDLNCTREKVWVGFPNTQLSIHDLSYDIPHRLKSREFKYRYSTSARMPVRPQRMKKYENYNLPSNFLGLNSVEAAKPSVVRDFVAERGGHTVITSVLIANNGIAAVKEIRSVRKWAYQTFGDEHAISFVAMATPEDLEANAEYIRMADQVIAVPGGTNNNNYANVDLIVDIAEQTGVQAVWAGWGHASENPLLPEKLAASSKKIVFIGPPGSAMRSLGDKISSTIVAQHANVPCIPWSGTGVDNVIIDGQSGLVSVDDETYAKGCSKTSEEGRIVAERIGLPVMIKASEGGGGKGIRKVEKIEDFESLYRQVESEIPGSPIFIMKLAGNARHLEVQLLADQYGNNISLFGRDCSVQRRHQKIIEEAPVEVASKETFSEMENAAVRLGRLVGYVSAGTVEYLYSHEDGKFFFLELNPRLQVEHPTTEMVSGVNLPAAQLQIAMGLPLDMITDIRMLYGADPLSNRPIDFEFKDPESAQFQRRPSPKGHTTACRITSEDPGEGFKPSGGTMHELNFRSSSNVWGYFSVGNRGNIHSFSDSQFGHIFAFGETREASRRSMIVALKELSIRGDFKTTVEYLIGLLETKDFENNTFTTGWLDELISRNVTTGKPDKILAVLCGAATMSHLETVALTKEYKAALERGQAPPKDAMKYLYEFDFIYENENYRFTSTRSSPDTYRLFLNGSRVEVGVRELSDGGLLIAIGGKSHVVYWKDEMGNTRLTVDSKSCLLEVENDPTQLRTPSPGKLIKFLVDFGDHITAGQSYAEVEVMKMIMPLIAQEDGVVQPIKQPGAVLEAGDILGILTLDDPSKVQHATPFSGQLPAVGPPQVEGKKLDSLFFQLLSTAEHILDGFDNQVVLQNTVTGLLDILRDPELPYSQWSQRASALHSRLPASLDHTLSDIVERAHAAHKEFPSKQVLRTLSKWCPTSSVTEGQIYNDTVLPLSEIATDYIGGIEGHEFLVISRLLTKYYDVELQFNGMNTETAIHRLRDEHKDDLQYVVNMVMSHSRIGNKNNFVLKLLEEYNPHAHPSGLVATHLRPTLKKLTELDDQHSTAKVVLKARELIIQCALPTIQEQSEQMEHILKNSVMVNSYGSTMDKKRRYPEFSILRELVDSKYSVYDVLFQFFCSSDPYITLAAAEVYARRVNRAYRVGNLQYHLGDLPAVTYDFEVDKSDSKLTRHGLVCPGEYEDIDEAISRAISLVPVSQVTTRARAVSDPPTPNGDIFSPELINTCNIIVFEPSVAELNDEEIAQFLGNEIARFSEELKEHRFRRITILIQVAVGKPPKFFTFQGPTYEENRTLRHVNPPLAFQLELNRLSNFHIHQVFNENRAIHVYEANAVNDSADKRYFVRTVVTPEQLHETDVDTAEYLQSESNRLMNDVVDILQVTDITGTDLNHIFINFTGVFHIDITELMTAFQKFLIRFGLRLWRLRVTAAEVRIVVDDIPIRAFIQNVSGFVVKSELYTEVKNHRGEWVYKSIGDGKPGNMHLRPVLSPYPTKEYLQLRRYNANLKGTTFVYDFPDLFKEVVAAQWVKLGGAPQECFVASELTFDQHGTELVEVDREPGANDCGMVAWLCTAKTREYPQGRRFVVIANDITYKIGSFGPREDKFFNLVTEMARKQGIPRLYISANSGARIGLADELLPHLKISWKDPTDPKLGFDYLYVNEEDYESVKASASYVRIVENGEVRYKIDYIIGKEDGLGVESLKGSALIAGATSRAYRDIFTITLVTSRSVGIGAYLVRLGQRTVQVAGKPLLLTGAEAINKLLGREVYSSNLQLGGEQVMFRNGVTHLLAANDYDGIAQIMDWLTFIPDCRGNPVPIHVNPEDTWDRDVTFSPQKSVAYDARSLITGCDTPDGFESGLFDKGSFVEVMEGWARGVIAGRARLGGIPFGVIAVETRTTETTYPADPANPLSTEIVIPEAAQVWYPNSAYKTAQAIEDFNNGEQLPLFILANWRGFSGGQRDMYFEILKYGSMIVDALTEYKQPVFVYIPPAGELRGGSWVVVDPSINTAQMEMFADTQSRGGILEPEGIVGIKMRRKKLLVLMERLDQPYRDLLSELEATDDENDAAELTAKIAEREDKLLPIYEQIAVQFAELHDMPGRMKAKNTVTEIVPWRESRRYFYWRARRRLAETYLGETIAVIADREFATDREAAEWYMDNAVLASNIANQRRENDASQKLVDLIKTEKGVDSLITALSELSPAQRVDLTHKLKQHLN
ncbi:acetyl-CoA carboxylase [Starmerella bacillaris]|uniref:Acetyl-CoA carboxylase n=1 Tax=Starmerella bacillaris TaxID=1247836 RepID=A0AAV5RJZ8_STABA|nr:acetyl-CoA carboxylase [Starmerella bacillaris]